LNKGAYRRGEWTRKRRDRKKERRGEEERKV
jgi:hypothetical protein